MWYTYSHKQALDNGDKVTIKVNFHDRTGEFYIDDIELIKKGKRKGLFVKSILTDEYSYRVLNSTDREKAIIKRFIEVAGLDSLNSALLAAWESTKPKVLIETDVHIKD